MHECMIQLLMFMLASYTSVSADYDCLCNYAVETTVLPTPDAGGQPIGYLYEFDCKPTASSHQNTNNFYAVQFEKQLGYVPSGPQIQMQTCPGDPPDSDLVASSMTTVGQGGIDVTTRGQTTLSTNTAQTTTTTTGITTHTARVTTMSTPFLTTQKLTSTSQAVTTVTTHLKSTTPYSYWLMAANVTGTPLQYIGIGYNLLTGNPELKTDPGFKTTQRIFQLTGNSSAVREVSRQEIGSCTASKVTTIIHGSKSYQDELLQFVQPSSTHSSSLKTPALAYGQAFTSFRQFLENGSNFYIDYISSCKLGSARYMTELADKNNFTVTKEFAKDVCSLPTDGNSTVEYMNFLDKWGTSIVTYVDSGMRTIERYETTPDQILKHSQQTTPQLLEHTGPYKGYQSSVSINPKDFINSPAANKPFGTRHTISMGTKQQSVPIAVKVVPISDALNWIYWEPIVDELMAEGICSDSIYGTGMQHYAKFIKAALDQYARHKDLGTGTTHTPLTDHGIQIPISWPVGTYGFMQSTHGCPAGGTTWLSGWRKQDTEDLGAKNSFSGNIALYLKGEFARNDIKTYFCIKNSLRTSLYDQTWQNGAYCLLKHGSCPNGFSSGFIYWDDEDLNNGNAKGGTLPDGTYDKNTRIYYCCRNDGSPQTPLLLPTERPFILVRYGAICQSVHGMNVHDIYIHWDDEDLNNGDSAAGMHPLDEGGSRNHQLHFCYYFSSSSPSAIG